MTRAARRAERSGSGGSWWASLRSFSRGLLLPEGRGICSVHSQTGHPGLAQAREILPRVRWVSSGLPRPRGRGRARLGGRTGRCRAHGIATCTFYVLQYFSDPRAACDLSTGATSPQGSGAFGGPSPELALPPAWRSRSAPAPSDTSTTVTHPARPVCGTHPAPFKPSHPSLTPSVTPRPASRALMRV